MFNYFPRSTGLRRMRSFSAPVQRSGVHDLCNHTLRPVRLDAAAIARPDGRNMRYTTPRLRAAAQVPHLVAQLLHRRSPIVLESIRGPREYLSRRRRPRCRHDRGQSRRHRSDDQTAWLSHGIGLPAGRLGVVLGSWHGPRWCRWVQLGSHLSHSADVPGW